MSDTSLPVIVRFDTTANRGLFTPAPGVPEQLYVWLDSDDQPNAYYWDGAAWQPFNAGVATGDVVGPGSATDEALARYDGTTGKLLQDSLITLSNTGALTFPDDVRQVFNPGANNPGINVGSFAGDPATPSNGDIWYNSTSNLLKARINGATVILEANTDTGITQLTGDVTAGPGSGSVAATIANSAVTDAKISDRTALSVFGRSANSNGVGADIVATPASGAVLRESASVVGWGTVATAGIANSAITYAKVQNVADGKVLGNFSGGAAAPSEYGLSSGLEQNSSNIRVKSSVRTQQVGITVDGAGVLLTTGAKGFKSAPWTGTLTGWRLMANAAGNIDFRVDLDAYAGFPPSTSILTPSLSGVQMNEATGLSQAVVAGDVFGFSITGTPLTITRATLELTIVVTG